MFTLHQNGSVKIATKVSQQPFGLWVCYYTIWCVVIFHLRMMSKYCAHNCNSVVACHLNVKTSSASASIVTQLCVLPSSKCYNIRGSHNRTRQLTLAPLVLWTSTTMPSQEPNNAIPRLHHNCPLAILLNLHRRQ